MSFRLLTYKAFYFLYVSRKGNFSTYNINCVYIGLCVSSVDEPNPCVRLDHVNHIKYEFMHVKSKMCKEMICEYAISLRTNTRET